MLNLNAENIRRANDMSNFDAGNVLAREAEAVYNRGLADMWPTDKAGRKAAELTEAQQAIYDRRCTEWQALVEKSYNDIISRRASWAPWTVTGPASYPAAKMNKRADAEINAASEWAEKRARFIENTREMIRNALPLEDVLAEYRTGKRDDAISSDDPHAAEKLAARLEYLREAHERGKRENAWFRKHKTMKGFPGLTDERAARLDAKINASYNLQAVPYPTYSASNATANIRRLESRLQAVQAQQARAEVAAVTENEHNGFTVIFRKSDARINITFDKKPDEAARNVLKRYGFHWSPKNQVWTRQLTDNARRAVRLYVIPGLEALDEYAPDEASAALTVAPDEAPAALAEAPAAAPEATTQAAPATAQEATSPAPDAIPEMTLAEFAARYCR